MSHLWYPPIYEGGTASVGQSATEPEEDVYSRRERPSRVEPPVEYKLPTDKELQNVKIDMINEHNEHERIPPTTKLDRPIEDYLPPSGPYFDQHAPRFSNLSFFVRGSCPCCWKQLSGDHAPRGQECNLSCRVCQTKNHLGKQCDALYMDMVFWEDLGVSSPTGVQIRPHPSEIAYLIVAGVLKPMKSVQDPILVNTDHPVVQQFYKDRDDPEPLRHMLQPEDRINKKVEAPKITARPSSQETVSQPTPAVHRRRRRIRNRKIPRKIGDFALRR